MWPILPCTAACPGPGATTPGPCYQSGSQEDAVRETRDDRYLALGILLGSPGDWITMLLSDLGTVFRYHKKQGIELRNWKTIKTASSVRICRWP
ncbi:hypothetical protein BDV35DRAFT_375180 [Aspergillus flavus]|uniref:Uncharacterized protein n=1 Tax=Aspergillus flavus TaxID=5059 RepID=A0A5N6GFC1_ASPFL|nr:hypothetical protein BDV35DRAFT_375180 [Aspergillus flavus]